MTKFVLELKSISVSNMFVLEMCVLFIGSQRNGVLMEECKLVKVYILVGSNLYIDQCPKTREKVKDGPCVPYASVVGSQMLTMVCTRPNISQEVGVLSTYMSTKEQRTTVMRVFKYLCCTSNYGICYQGRIDIKGR